MKYIDFILKALFPPRCLACGASISAGVICERCLGKIPLFETLFCARCGARLPRTKKICHADAPYLLGSAGPYDNATLKLLVHQLKFRSARLAARPLADLIARYLENITLDLDGFMLIPLPLHWRRKNERGFNQAEEIARCLTDRVPLKIRTDVLVRSRYTEPQTGTGSVAKRRENVLGCFSVVKPTDVLRKNIILLDDVATSGATLGEAARALRTAGARKIIGLTAAKA
jgi:ComF family protein